MGWRKKRRKLLELKRARKKNARARKIRQSGWWTPEITDGNWLGVQCCHVLVRRRGTRATGRLVDQVPCVSACTKEAHNPVSKLTSWPGVLNVSFSGN